VAVLGVDRRAGAEGEALALDREADIADGFQVHLDPAHPVVPDRAVAERFDWYVGLELGVDAVEQVEVERGGDAAVSS
jgi:hypothetical protein